MKRVTERIHRAVMDTCFPPKLECESGSLPIPGASLIPVRSSDLKPVNERLQREMVTMVSLLPARKS